MMDIGLVIIIAIVAVLFGLFLGFILSKATSKGENISNLQNQMDSLQERFTSYQNEVANHFNTTATLANKITQDYQQLQAHLAHSVETLVANDDTRAKLLVAIKTPLKALDYAPEASTPNSTTTPQSYSDTPKDYAPKVPGQIGTLAEKFGAKHD